MLNSFAATNDSSAESARLAFLIGWERVRTARSIHDILDDQGRVEQLAAMAREFSFSLPTASYYAAGQDRGTTLKRFLDEVKRLVGNIDINVATAQQLSGQLNATIQRVPSLAVYHSDGSGVGYIAWFATLGPSPVLNAIIVGKDQGRLPLYTVEAYIGACRQRVDHAHAIFIMQGSITQPAMRHLLETYIGGVINVGPVHVNTRAALCYMKRQLVAPRSSVHFLCAGTLRRIPGYESIYSELQHCRGYDIVAAGSQGDCPSVVSSCHDNASRVAYHHAATAILDMAGRAPTTVARLHAPVVVSVREDALTVLKVLVRYFGIGGIHESINYTEEARAGGQAHMFTLSSWHGHPCVLIDQALYNWLDIRDTLNTGQWRYYDRVQLYVLASDPGGDGALRSMRDITHALQQSPRLSAPHLTL
jgi:hypothetical protein